MAYPITGQEIGEKLMKALGLPETTVGFTLRCYPNEFVSVTCEYLPVDGDGIVTALAEFSLLPNDSPSDSKTDE